MPARQSLRSNPHFMKSALARYRRRTSSSWSTLPNCLARKDAWAVVVATGPRRKSSRCCWTNARRAASTAARPCRYAISQHADGAISRRCRRPGRCSAQAGDRHRRPVHPQARRDRICVRSCPPLRPQGRRASACLGPADLGRGAIAVPRACRSRDRGRSPAAARPASARRRSFTHRGLSGPAILQISSYWKPGEDDRDRFPSRRERRACSRPPSELALRPTSPPRCAATYPRGLPKPWFEKLAVSGDLGNVSDRSLDAGRATRCATGDFGRAAPKASPRRK